MYIVALLHQIYRLLSLSSLSVVLFHPNCLLQNPVSTIIATEIGLSISDIVNNNFDSCSTQPVTLRSSKNETDLEKLLLSVVSSSPLLSIWQSVGLLHPSRDKKLFLN